MAGQMAVQPSLVMSRLRCRVAELEKDSETLTTRLDRAQHQLHAVGKVRELTV